MPDELREKIYQTIVRGQVDRISAEDTASQILQAVQDYYANLTPEEVRLTNEEIWKALDDLWKNQFDKSIIFPYNPLLEEVKFVRQAQLAKASAYYEAKIEQARKEERERIFKELEFRGFNPQEWELDLYKFWQALKDSQ